MGTWGTGPHQWINIYIPTCLIFQFYLMYRLICQKLTRFCLPKWLWWAPFFQMIIVLRVYNYEAYFCVMAERSHGKKSNWLSNPMGYAEVHIEYSTAQPLPTFPRGTPSDQPSFDCAADAAPPSPPNEPPSRRAVWRPSLLYIRSEK